jgi:hypothetical protein
MISFGGPYVGIFGHPVDDESAIDRIEIPLIQRDYAQGRDTPEVALIRSDFLNVLFDAISGGPAVGLDFVYGDVKNGTLRPLDGQQRLTTLFLLHWYLASRIGLLEPELAWTRFDYATRPSARLFCERIVEHPAPADASDLATWIADQSWFQHLWFHDPTIQAMLTMIDAIERKCEYLDHQEAWNRLTDLAAPAVWFHVLPIEEAGAGDNLYIKMNSRGRPLTRFENFKARFERALEGSPRAKDFSTKIDGPWSDLFWPFRDEENKTDNQFERFFLFITETLEWRAGRILSGRLGDRAANIFSPTHDPHGVNLDFLINVLDAWAGLGEVDAYFEALFKRPGINDSPGSLPLFGGRVTINLFRACADSYGMLVNATQRSFGWAETLLLYAVQVHLINETPELARRLRTLRNLTENSTNELRLAAMPALIACVERFMLAGTYDEALAELDTFNSAQIEDEQEKAEFLTNHPGLESLVFELEDSPILRGSLVSFELDAEAFASRARSFRLITADPSTWPAFTGALLACGDYSRIRGNRFIRFGSGTEIRWWRELLTGGTRSSLVSTAKPLGVLLNLLSDGDQVVADTLHAITERWLAAQVSFDWRYYLVKYQIMRSGTSGIYTGLDGQMGYQLCMLNRTQMNSRYRDPFLSAIAEKAKAWQAVNSLLFTGYEFEERWMQFKASGTRIRCAPEGFVVALPPDPEAQGVLEPILDLWGIGDDLTLRVDQTAGVDTEDRVEKCARFISDLIEGKL